MLSVKRVLVALTVASTVVVANTLPANAQTKRPEQKTSVNQIVTPKGKTLSNEELSNIKGESLYIPYYVKQRVRNYVNSVHGGDYWQAFSKKQQYINWVNNHFWNDKRKKQAATALATQGIKQALVRGLGYASGPAWWYAQTIVKSSQLGWWLGSNYTPDPIIDKGADIYQSIRW